MKTQKQKTGQAALIAVLLMLVIMLSAIFGVSLVALKEAKVAEENKKSKLSFFAAEAGLEDAVYRIKNGKNIGSSVTILLNDTSAVVNISSVGLSDKEIISSGNAFGAVRAVKSLLKHGVGASFNYGVQVGDGGLFLENTSKVIGSVYSNGDIDGKNSSEITGDAFAAGTSRIKGINNLLVIGGNASAHIIEESGIAGTASSTTEIKDSTVSKNAYADTITDSAIGQDAYYFTSMSGSTVGGFSFPGTPPPADLPSLGFPISDAQISQWEASAQAGGIHTSPCPYAINKEDGPITMGPIKINCNLTLGDDAMVIVNGPIWIIGNLSMKNRAQLKLNPDYGALSGVVIADNPSNRTTSSKITVENNSQVLGSGLVGSYLALISQNNSAELGGGEFAIHPKSSTGASIYYAPHGRLNIENSVSLKEASAYKIHIKNTSTVTYETGLAGINFSSGPSGGWDINNWQETLPQ